MVEDFQQARNGEFLFCFDSVILKQTVKQSCRIVKFDSPV